MQLHVAGAAAYLPTAILGLTMTARCLVVIPAYNEEETIEQVVRAASAHADVCVVDDGSNDATPEILSRLSEQLDGFHMVTHVQNTHIAGAILDGMRLAQDEGYDFVITMDAGMSHDPSIIPGFQRYAEADLVLGYREKRVDVPWFRKALSGVATWLLNLVVKRRFLPWGGAGLRDATSGYRMYSKAAVDLLLRAPLRARTFDFHLEALTHVYRAGMRIEETPITYVFTNSSLRWSIVRDAARTCARLWLRRDGL